MGAIWAQGGLSTMPTFSKPLVVGLVLSLGFTGFATVPVYFHNASKHTLYLLPPALPGGLDISIGTSSSNLQPHAVLPVGSHAIAVPPNTLLSLAGRPAWQPGSHLVFKLLDRFRKNPLDIGIQVDLPAASAGQQPAARQFQFQAPVSLSDSMRASLNRIAHLKGGVVELFLESYDQFEQPSNPARSLAGQPAAGDIVPASATMAAANPPPLKQGSSQVPQLPPPPLWLPPAALQLNAVRPAAGGGIALPKPVLPAPGVVVRNLTGTSRTLELLDLTVPLELLASQGAKQLARQRLNPALRQQLEVPAHGQLYLQFASQLPIGPSYLVFPEPSPPGQRETATFRWLPGPGRQGHTAASHGALTRVESPSEELILFSGIQLDAKSGLITILEDGAWALDGSGPVSTGDGSDFLQ